LAKVKESQYEIRSTVVEVLLRRIDDERVVAEIKSLVDAAKVDPDAATTCGKRLLDLRAAIDEIEDELAWPELQRNADRMMVAIPEIVEANGDPYDKQALPGYVEQVRAAKDRHDPELLRQRLNELIGLGRSALDRNGGMQLMYFEDLSRKTAAMSSPQRAERLVAEGQAAADRQDISQLREINRQLIDLLPEPPQEIDPFSTVRKG
jgi:molecular chaperone DnaK